MTKTPLKPLTEEIDTFLRSTIKAATKVKDDIYLWLDVLKVSIQWHSVISKTGGGADSNEGALLDIYKQFLSPAGQREGDTRARANGAVHPATTQATGEASAPDQTT